MEIWVTAPSLQEDSGPRTLTAGAWRKMRDQTALSLSQWISYGAPTHGKGRGAPGALPAHKATSPDKSSTASLLESWRSWEGELFDKRSWKLSSGISDMSGLS